MRICESESLKQEVLGLEDKTVLIFREREQERMPQIEDNASEDWIECGIN